MPKSKTDLEVKSTGDSASGQTKSDNQKTGEPTAHTQQDSNIIDATNEESNTQVNEKNLFIPSTSGGRFKPDLHAVADARSACVGERVRHV